MLVFVKEDILKSFSNEKKEQVNLIKLTHEDPYTKERVEQFYVVNNVFMNINRTPVCSIRGSYDDCLKVFENTVLDLIKK